MIKVVIDSSCDVTQEEAKKLGITVLPFEVRFGEEEYLDGVNLTHKRFYEKLIESDELPKTSLLSAYKFEECFKELSKDGDEIVCITISSKLSGTYSEAVKAAKEFENVYVVDSLNACSGERLLLELALELIKENKSAKEIAETLNTEKKKIKLLALLGTLKYLKKGGRISSVAAFTGEMLSVKPVVSIVDGEVKLAGKALGSKKGNNLLMQLIDKCGGINFDKPYCTMYSGTDDSVLIKYIEDSKHIWEGKTNDIPKYEIGTTIGTHIGPGAIGVCFFAK